jgi:ATP-binding cassette subfamily B protein
MKKKSEKTTFKENMGYLFSGYKKIAEKTPQFLPLAFFIAFINALQPMIILFFSARILNELSGAKKINYIIFYTAATIILTFLLSAVRSVLSARQELNAGGYIGYIKTLEIQAEKFAVMDYPQTENSELRNTLNDIETKMRGNGAGLLKLIYSSQGIFQNIFALIIAVALLFGMFTPNTVYTKNFATSPAAIPVLVAIVAAGLFSIALYRRKEKIFLENNMSHNAKSNSTGWYYGSYIKSGQAAKDVRLFHQRAALKHIFDTNFGLNYWIKLSFFFGRFGGYSSAVMAFTGGAVYLLIGLRALAGMYEIGSVVQYVGAVTALIGAVNALAGELGQLYNNCIFIKPLMDYLNMPDILAKGKLPVEKRGNNDYEIEFKNVSFKYPGSENYVLKNLNLKIHIGQRMAVVGQNGSGKTTMIKLLCRLYDPTEGEITLNGRDIKNYDYGEYMGIFSVVFQDFELLPFTLAQNIAASVEYESEKIKQALSKSGFDTRLAGMPKNIETYLYKNFEEDGVEISGGEAQKIALSRALYKDAPFIVLDEPTAALDPVAEFEIYSKFNEIVGDKTAIYISHRLSSCKFCDDIAVLHEGELIQRGSHDTLISDEGGKYHELWNAQARHYVT